MRPWGGHSWLGREVSEWLPSCRHKMDINIGVAVAKVGRTFGGGPGPRSPSEPDLDLEPARQRSVCWTVLDLCLTLLQHPGLLHGR